MSDADLALLPVLLPLAGAGIALLGKAFGSDRSGRAAEAVAATVGLFAPLAVLLLLLPVVRNGGVTFVVGDRGTLLGVVQRFDALSWLVDILGFFGACAAWLYSRGAGPRGPLFTAFFLLQTSALAATASCADLFNLFVCLEVLGLASYALTAASHKGESFLAAFSYLAVSSAAMGFFLLGVFGLYRLTGTLSYDGIAARLLILGAADEKVAALSLACLVASTAVRVAILPVYGWLPDAHATAPHAVSAVLSGVLIKTPLFALGRVIAMMGAASRLGETLGSRTLGILGAAGTVTALSAVVVALCQRDAKRLLAYHSISQIGYITAAWALGTPAALSVAWFHAFSHALFKGLLFLSVGAATDAVGGRDVYEIRGAAAVLRLRGDRGFLSTACFAVGALSIAAVPPFNGFASKSAVVHLFHGDWRSWVLNAAAVGTIASMIKLSRIFFPDRSRSASDRGAPDYRMGWTMRAAMTILAALCLGTGLFSIQVLNFAGTLMGASPGAIYSGPYSPTELLKTSLILISGILAYFLATSGPGKRVASAIRDRERSFTGLIAAFAGALAVVAAWLSA